MAGRLWTKQEDKLVRKLFGTMTVAEVAKRVGRPFPATRLRAFKVLGLRCRGPRLEWSKKEDAKLRAMFPSNTFPDLSKLLKRTEDSVKSRARKLGLRRDILPAAIGTERYFKREGLLKRLVTLDPDVYWSSRWRSVHTLVWESVHGPVPEGYWVCFKPGMKVFDSALITVDRLELLSGRELMLRNSLHRYPPEVAQTMRLRAALKRQIAERSKELIQ